MKLCRCLMVCRSSLRVNCMFHIQHTVTADKATVNRRETAGNIREKLADKGLLLSPIVAQNLHCSV